MVSALVFGSVVYLFEADCSGVEVATLDGTTVSGSQGERDPRPIPGVEGLETHIDADKLAIIELIEDRLSAAFTIRTEEDTPCFGTLDLIYPRWHKGKPVKARRQWTFHDYKTYRAAYHVFSVFLSQPDQATVVGEVRIKQSRWFTFFIFPPELIRETFKYKFRTLCRRKLDGDWEILKEVRE